MMSGQVWSFALFAAFFICCLDVVYPVAVGGNSALLYLSQYGYLEPVKGNSRELLHENTIRRAVEDFQLFTGLNVTGELDEQTLETMTLPRCGVKDKVGTGDNRAKRQTMQVSRWKTKNLSYKISNYPADMNPEDVDAEIQRAFDVWSDVTDLTFTPKSGQVHIEIRFESGEHGDNDPFDGPGQVLAHASFPPQDQQYLTGSHYRQGYYGVGVNRQYNTWFNNWPRYTPYKPRYPGNPRKVSDGFVHFDAAEQWTINPSRDANLFQVAAHEFGHSLGLTHSDMTSAIMTPIYRYRRNFHLDQDDIDRIQALYGKKTKQATPSFDQDDGVDENQNIPNKIPYGCRNPPYGSLQAWFCRRFGNHF